MAMHTNLDISVRVKTKDLIKALKANKELHLKDYKKALEVWFKDLKEIYISLLKEIETRNMNAKYEICLQSPINNEKLYEKYIGMFEMTTDDTIEISSEDYGCIVDDNWDWARTASVHNNAYSSKW